MAVRELILLLCEIARDKWCSYWEHDPGPGLTIAVRVEFMARQVRGTLTGGKY